MRTNTPKDNHVDEGAPALLGSLVDVGPAAVSPNLHVHQCRAMKNMSWPPEKEP